MSTTGTYLPAFLIFPRKRMRPELLLRAPPGSDGHGSEYGWVNSELFAVFLQHFAHHVKPTLEAPILLLVDNHASHMTLAAMEFCQNHHIVMIGFPPHTTHRLQPLEVSFFGPLKMFYNQTCDDFSITYPGQVIPDCNNGELLTTAYCKAATVGNAVRGFKECGIEPFNSQIFHKEDFVSAESTERRTKTVHAPAALGKDLQAEV